jgi:hypothetical protein
LLLRLRLTFAPAAAAALTHLQRLRESLPSGGAAGVKSSLSWMAGLVVVGDEILSGKVEDSNISFLCTRLYEIGWTVRKVSRGPRSGFWGLGLFPAVAGWREVFGLGTSMLEWSLLKCRQKAPQLRLWAGTDDAPGPCCAVLCCVLLCSLQQVSIVPDDVAAIAKEVAALSASCQV